MVDLPNDIIAIICSHLNMRPSELIDLMLVSHSFYHIARPMLYHTVNLERASATAQLLRTFLDRPDSASLVRKMSLEIGHDDEDDERGAVDPTDTLSREDLGRASVLVDGLNLPRNPRTALRTEVDRASRDGIMCLILCLCGELRSLDITLDVVSDADFTQNFFHGLLPYLDPIRGLSPGEEGARPLRKVDTLYLRVADSESTARLANHSHWLSLPSLKTFGGAQLDFVHDPYKIRNTLELPVGKLRKIDLVDCLIDHESLPALLSACPLLHELCVDWGYGAVGLRSICVDSGKIGEVLLQYASELRTLRLHSGSLMAVDYKSGEAMDSLTSMSKLRHLDVSWDTIFSDRVPEYQVDRNYLVNLLPVALETFKISSFSLGSDEGGEELDAQLKALMERSGRFESLRRIETVRAYPYRLETPPSWRFSCAKLPGFPRTATFLEKI